MLRRIGAYVERVAEGDPEDLATMVEVAEEFESAVGDAVRGMRARLGWSWGELARPLGRSRQALQQRWGGGA